MIERGLLCTFHELNPMPVWCRIGCDCYVYCFSAAWKLWCCKPSCRKQSKHFDVFDGAATTMRVSDYWITYSMLLYTLYVWNIMSWCVSHVPLLCRHTVQHSISQLCAVMVKHETPDRWPALLQLLNQSTKSTNPHDRQVHLLLNSCEVVYLRYDLFINFIFHTRHKKTLNIYELPSLLLFCIYFLSLNPKK